MGLKFESDEATNQQSDGGEGTRARRHRGTKEDAPPLLDGRPPPPLVACDPPTPEEQLPHALTFFLTAGQRRAVLEILRAHHARRAEALLQALGITHD